MISSKSFSLLFNYFHLDVYHNINRLILTIIYTLLCTTLMAPIFMFLINKILLLLLIANKNPLNLLLLQWIFINIFINATSFSKKVTLSVCLYTDKRLLRLHDYAAEPNLMKFSTGSTWTPGTDTQITFCCDIETTMGEVGVGSLYAPARPILNNKM